MLQQVSAKSKQLIHTAETRLRISETKTKSKLLTS